MTSLRFGLQNETIFSTNSATINAFYPIRKHLFFATTRNGLYRFEGTNINKIYPYKLSTSMIIPEYGFFVGISSVGGEIFVMMLEDMENPLISRFKTDQVAIFHIAYSHKSHVLITVGSGIYIWNFNVTMPFRKTLIHRPTVEITLRAKLFSDYDTSILNPISLDYDQELLYFPTKTGFGGFDFDGHEKKSFSRVEVNAQTASALCIENKKFITARHSDGFHLWGKNGFLIKKIPGGVSSILAIRFINKYFAIFMDSNLYVSIIDIKTSKTFHCTTFSTKPTYFNVITYNNKYFLIVSQGWAVKMMEIVLPWIVWKNMTTQTYSIRRCPKYKDAARILAFYQSTVFSFLSPKDGKNLTSAVDTQPSAALYHLYERGLFIEHTFDQTNYFIESTHVFEIDPNNKRDVLFVTTEEANTSIFSTGNNPCQLVKIIELQMSAIIVCELNGKFMYCSSTSQGELMFHNYSDFAQVKRVLIKKDPIKKIFYHRKSSSIIVVFKDEFHRFDLNQFKDVLTLPIKDGGYSEFFGNLLFFGCKNGTIEAFRIEPVSSNNWIFTQVTDNCIHFHDDAITSFAFSPNFFISASADNTLKIWNYHFGLIFDIVFPFPLLTCEILNGSRDILIGTDNEILIVKGKSIWNDEVDPEIPELDNYDKISDELTNQLIQFVTSQNEEDEMSDFLGDRLKKKEKEKQTPSRHNINTNYIQKKTEFVIDEPKENLVAKDSGEMTEEERNRRIAEMNEINEKSDKELRQQKTLLEMKKKDKLREEEEMKKKQEEELKRKQEDEDNEKKEEEKKKKLEEKKKKEEEAKEKRRKKREEMRAEKRRRQEQQNQQVKFVDLDELMPVFKEIKEISDDEKQKDKNQFARQKQEYKPKQPSVKRPQRPFRPNAPISKNEENDDDNDSSEIEDENEDLSENENEEEEEVLVLRKPTSSHTNVRTLGKKDKKNQNQTKNNPDNDQMSSEINSSNENEQINAEISQSKNGHINNENQQLSKNGEINNEISQSKNEQINNENQKLSKNGQINNENQKSSKNSKTNSTDDKSIQNKENDDEVLILRKEGNNNIFKRKNKFVTSEISTQTENAQNEDTDNEEIVNEKKKKAGNDDVIISKSQRKQAESDDSITLHSPKKKLSSMKLNSVQEPKDKKSKKNQKTKREKSPLFNPNHKSDQIFLTQQLKRSPTPPPLRPINNSPEKLSSKKYKVLPPRLFVRRSRTPPIFRQQKLVILPGPEIVLDKEIVISRILSGHVELIPLLSRFPCEYRKRVILELKARNLVDDDEQPVSLLDSYFTTYTYQKRKDFSKSQTNKPNVSIHRIEIDHNENFQRPKAYTSISMKPTEINKSESGQIIRPIKPFENQKIETAQFFESIQSKEHQRIQSGEILGPISDGQLIQDNLNDHKKVRNSSPSAISPQLIHFPDPNARSNFSKDTKRPIRYRNGIVSKMDTLNLRTYNDFEEPKRPKALLNNLIEKPEAIPLIKMPKSEKSVGPYSVRYNQNKRSIRLISANLDFVTPDTNHNVQLQSQLTARNDKLRNNLPMDLVAGSQVSLNPNNRSRNMRQKLVVGRSFSPPVLYKPKLLEKYKQVFQAQRNNNNS